jgi:hypothetical protein
MTLRTLGGFTHTDLHSGLQNGLSNGNGSSTLGGLTSTSRDLRDDQMDQIRDLLFGDLKRQMDARFAAIETRLNTLEARVQAVSNESVATRRETLDDLSRGIGELGDYIRRIARP